MSKTLFNKRLTLSRLTLSTKDVGTHWPFVAIAYCDTREGSYVTWGRRVHKTIMWKST